ncbi:aminotransferase class IV [Niabella beijingensis]|uniref:aminotransferase class IV n=1 Tax=Niabella beijingensis TaxID=2872700 RepID=UPI001CBCB037|nr:aminotransferase class IV [Niabella beijingensis]MBZ4188396.1 aminotransferase class IV [Niabella beijingensis]
MRYVCFNGTFSAAGMPVIHAANRSYRYGDGFFETLRVHRSAIPLWKYHQARILKSIAQLGYTFAQDPEALFNNILHLCTLNNCADSARVRLSFSNGDGSLFDDAPLHYLIEATAFTTPAAGNGLLLGRYDELQKEVHAFSELKLASSFIYSRAAQTCRLRGWDDCIIENTRHQAIETVISNLFWIKEGQLFTPPVSDGCVAGVFRAYLLDTGPHIAIQSCLPGTLEHADEVFLTNALRGIRKVQQIGDTGYKTARTELLLQQHTKLFS